MVSLKRSAVVEAEEACRAVLAAAETCLLAEGIALPATRYVSIQGGDWIAANCEDCCSQLVVTPMTELARFNDPTTIASGGLDGRRAQTRLVSYEINLSAPVNLAVLSNRLAVGNPALAHDVAANRNTHWSETVPLIAARWALVRGIEQTVRDELCAAGFVCMFAVLGSVTPWLEGGCAGTKVTVQVQQ